MGVIGGVSSPGVCDRVIAVSIVVVVPRRTSLSPTRLHFDSARNTAADPAPEVP